MEAWERRGQGRFFEPMHLIPILPLYLIVFILHNRKSGKEV